MNDFIKEHGKEFIRTVVAVMAAVAIVAPPAAQFIDIKKSELWRIPAR